VLVVIVVAPALAPVRTRPRKTVVGLVGFEPDLHRRIVFDHSYRIADLVFGTVEMIDHYRRFAAAVLDRMVFAVVTDNFVVGTLALAVLALGQLGPSGFLHNSGFKSQQMLQHWCISPPCVLSCLRFVVIIVNCFTHNKGLAMGGRTNKIQIKKTNKKYSNK
jgi:hypothetical protein